LNYLLLLFICIIVHDGLPINLSFQCTSFRVFLNINPHTGGKRSGKSKRKGKTFDTDVFNLAKAELSAFPDTDFVDAQTLLDE